MKKRFWKLHAILMFLLFIWYFFAYAELGNGNIPKLGYVFMPFPLIMVVGSCITLVANKKKSKDAIVGYYFDGEGKNPKEKLRIKMYVRGILALVYSVTIGMSFYPLEILGDSLRFGLMIGTMLLGAIYMLIVLFDYAKKVGELDEKKVMPAGRKLPPPWMLKKKE